MIIDEVHERNVDSDFLLILARDLLTRRPGLKAGDMAICFWCYSH